MIKNYFVIAWRSLLKHFTYSSINILGLSLGFATFILLATWIKYELSYDQFHEKSKQIYRGSMEYSFGGQVAKTSVSPSALLPILQTNFAEIENGVRIYNPSAWRPFIVHRDDKLFQEGKFYFADSSFFKVFSFKLIEGNPEKALTLPQSVVLTQTMAKKYFGDKDPIGQILQVNDKTDYTVTGIMENVPSNSHIQFDFMASFSSLRAANEPPTWWSANYQTFITLNTGSDVNAISQKTNNIVKKELAGELTNPGDYVKYNFMPLSDIYLRSNVDESEIVSSIEYIYLFGAIAILIVIIACINYINLATARATDRAKEVGIRKVVGAARKQLFFQFIGESFIITFISFVIAFIIAQVSLTSFNLLTGKSFDSTHLFDPEFLILCFIAAIIVALLAGIYPALTITSFKPAGILKGNFKNSGKGVWLRQSLVVFQFTVSITLIVGTLIIFKQINFIQSKRLGYDKENVLVLPLDQKTNDSFPALKTELLRNGKAKFVARATESPTKIKGGYSLNINGSEKGIITTAVATDEDFVPAMKMELLIGRNFTEADFAKAQQDTSHSSYTFILNESALKEISVSLNQAVGTKIKLNGRTGEIIGVIRDFHFSSLHEKISPLVLFNEPEQLNFIFVKLNPGNVKETLTSIKEIWANIMPHRPFEYKFLDEQYQALYSSEQRIGSTCTVFATLTIIIACLGLSGLVAFAVSQKIKEIGIRKVLGASALSIVLLITKGYGKLVIIAILIGLPLAYYLIENLWMSSFAYKATIGAWPFIIAAVSCVLIAFGTASLQAIRAATIDPANTLKNE